MSEILSLKQILNLIDCVIEDVSNHGEVWYSKEYMIRTLEMNKEQIDNWVNNIQYLSECNLLSWNMIKAESCDDESVKFSSDNWKYKD